MDTVILGTFIGVLIIIILVLLTKDSNENDDEVEMKILTKKVKLKQLQVMDRELDTQLMSEKLSSLASMVPMPGGNSGDEGSNKSTPIGYNK